ncbi:DUF742 domain-containing protein [Streptomyces bambusae]|uniref:DUF742 domain-containing protein n=1 Tax=Streptomyces bambusae TaxID=1550616 RepID=UPI001CFD982F|nr:DUF742 domain-containing protein [Streptomyces bambusae]MCB5164613.1 DUF742 domain-containing protein [Streptomyces bambusae]
MSTVSGGPEGPDAVADGFGPRPYTLTRGRIHASRPLRLETLVETVGRPDGYAALPEHDRILDLCGRPRSVAEVSALVGLPVGVVRVLVSDLADGGQLRVHEQDGHSAPASMLGRLLHGLERL